MHDDYRIYLGRSTLCEVTAQEPQTHFTSSSLYCLSTRFPRSDQGLVSSHYRAPRDTVTPRPIDSEPHEVMSNRHIRPCSRESFLLVSIEFLSRQFPRLPRSPTSRIRAWSTPPIVMWDLSLGHCHSVYHSVVNIANRSCSPAHSLKRYNFRLVTCHFNRSTNNTDRACSHAHVFARDISGTSYANPEVAVSQHLNDHRMRPRQFYLHSLWRDFFSGCHTLSLPRYYTRYQSITVYTRTVASCSPTHVTAHSIPGQSHALFMLLSYYADRYMLTCTRYSAR